MAQLLKRGARISVVTAFVAVASRPILITIFLFSFLHAQDWRPYKVYNPRIDIWDVTAGHSHDGTIVFFDGRWIAQYDDGTEKAGQRIHQKMSDDLEHWDSIPNVYCTSGGSQNPCSIDPTADGLYQPSLIVVKNHLWSFWMRTSEWRLEWSVLDSATGKWLNKGPVKFARGGNADNTKPLFNGIEWGMFAGNSGKVLSNGRIIQNVTLASGALRRDGWVYSDDTGKTWQYSPGTYNSTIENGAWENTEWECGPPGHLMMMARNKSGTGLAMTEAIGWAESFDWGATWTQPKGIVPMELANDRVHAVPYGPRRILVNNDFWTSSTIHNLQRRNLALFFSRGNWCDFTAGLSIKDDADGVDYANMYVKDTDAVVIYTNKTNRMNTSFPYRHQEVARISPLPDPAKYYIFPRKNRGNDPVDTTIDARSCLRFVNDMSSAGLDIDSGSTARTTLNINLDFRNVTGNNTIITMGWPAVSLVTSGDSLKLVKGATTVFIDTFSAWTSVEIECTPRSIKARADRGKTDSVSYTPSRGRWVYLGAGYYQNRVARPGNIFAIDVASVKTRITASPVSARANKSRVASGSDLQVTSGTDRIKISTCQAGRHTINLMGLDGRVITRYQGNGAASYTFRSENFSARVYLIQAEINGRAFAQKVVPGFTERH